MSTEIRLPKLSDNMEEGTVVRWFKRVGDAVQKGEPLAEIETDKADVELEAEASGVLEEVRVAEGSSAPVGAVLAVLGSGDKRASGDGGRKPAAERTDGDGAGKAARPAPGKEGAAPKEEARPPKEKGREEEKAKEKKEQPAAAARPEPARPAEARPMEARPAPAARSAVRASPLAWKLAEDLGISLEDVRGSGPGGRIVRADVESAARKLGRPAAEAPPAPAPQAKEGEKAPAASAQNVQPHTKMRQTIARRMSEAKRFIPHFYVTTEIDMGAAMKARQTLKEAGRIPNLTVTHLVVRALTLALLEHPRLNASWREDGLVLYPNVNMGIAVAVDDGLIVPVLQKCERLSLKEVAAGVAALSERARSGKFAGEDLTGGTFSLSNLGMLDVEEFAAIINPPQSALLATGSVKDRPVVRDGHLAVAKTMRATLSCDHRVVNGVEAGRFLEELKALLESPVLLLGD